MTRNRGLGRGLDALIPSTAEGADEIDVDLIVPNPHQPRSPIDESTLVELVGSIREHGVLQPLLVSGSESPGVYQLIAGERRLRAAKLAGLRRVPVVVKEAASRELLELALVENLQRQDLNAVEEALAFQRLAEEFTMTQEQIAARMGRSRAAVANSVRLLALSDELKESLVGGAISEGHARTLLGLERDEDRRRAWMQVLEGGLTVRQTEELVRRWPQDGASTRRTKSATADPNIESLEAKLRSALATKVELHRRRNGRGRVVIHFHSDEELNGLLERLGAMAAD